MTGFLLTAKQKLMLCINKRLYWCYRPDWPDRPDWCYRRDWPDRPDWCYRRNWRNRPDRPDWCYRRNWPDRCDWRDWPDGNRYPGGGGR